MFHCSFSFFHPFQRPSLCLWVFSYVRLKHDVVNDVQHHPSTLGVLNSFLSALFALYVVFMFEGYPLSRTVQSYCHTTPFFFVFARRAASRCFPFSLSGF